MKMADEIARQINDLKTTLSNNMAALKDVAGKNGLSVSSRAFDIAEAGLSKDDFTIVVFGEQKNGKSSFVNALLGRTLLPVGVEVTTSQAFRITNSEEESFYLVFADGGREKITAEELVAYGRETDGQRERSPLARGRDLLYIEVNTPAAFLPKGVHLFDTPGLGALYPAHAKVTNRCLAMANAAIFIKDVSSPVKETELGFINSAFSMTKNVMFVLNKADVAGTDAVNALLSRNEELLNREFRKTAGRELKMWPFSSANLIDAGVQTNPALQGLYKESSGYSALFDAIRSLIDSTVGFTGCYVACQESFTYYRTLDGAIGEQMQILGTTDASERRKLTEAKQRKRDEFLKEWGPNGVQIRNVNDKVNDICRQGNNLLQEIFGDVQRTFIAEIEALPADMEQINEYVESLPGRISSRIEYRWNEIITDVVVNVRNLPVSMNLVSSEMAVGGLSSVTRNNGLKLTDVVSSVTTGGLVSTVVGFALTSLICPPVGVIGGLVSWFLASKNTIDNRRAAAAKQDMRVYVGNAVAECRRNLLCPASVSEKSQASLFFDGIRRQVADTCASLAEEEKGRLESEFAELEAKARMNVDEAKNRIEELKAARRGLERLKASLLSSRDSLVALAGQLKF